MGTRNLFTIVLNKKVVLAKYNQWDGYLDGQGKYLSDFIVNDLDFEKLYKGLSNVKFVSDSEIDKKIQGAENTEFPLLYGDTGISQVLDAIQNLKYNTEKTEFKHNEMLRTKIEHSVTPENLITSNASGFLKDGLYCEYSYKLDLDTNTITVSVTNKLPNGYYGACDKVILKCDILQYPDKLDALIKKQES